MIMTFLTNRRVGLLVLIVVSEVTITLQQGIPSVHMRLTCILRAECTAILPSIPISECNVPKISMIV